MHQHCHHHRPDYGRAFAIGTALNIGYVLVESGFGFALGSLSLLADAGHNLSDVFGLLLAWGAYRLAKVGPSEKFTYGLGSSTILASLSNSLLLLVAVGGISWEAIRRFSQPVDVSGTTMIWVAAVGVAINTATALLFFKGHAHDLNIKGAFLHMAADAAVSLGVVVAGVAILLTRVLWIDPLVSLLIAGVILIGTWSLMRDSLRLAVHGVPNGIDVKAIHSFLAALPGIEQVHDLHVWGLSTTDIALTAHLVKPTLADDDALLASAIEQLRDEFGIEHATLQIEHNELAATCRQADPHTI
jgi:cobalt-zinc-cadmium efflux system protein